MTVPLWLAILWYLLGPAIWGALVGLFYGWCRRRAHRSIWCERRITAEARRRHNAFTRILPRNHTIVIRDTSAGDIYVTTREVNRDA